MLECQAAQMVQDEHTCTNREPIPGDRKANPKLCGMSVQFLGIHVLHNHYKRLVTYVTVAGRQDKEVSKQGWS